MACEHEENESIDQEKGKLTLPQTAPAVIQHGATTINVYVETGHANANEKLNSTLEALDLVAKNHSSPIELHSICTWERIADVLLTWARPVGTARTHCSWVIR